MLLQDGVADRVNLESVKNLLLGGARFSYGTYEAVFRKYRGKFAPNVRVYNFYGPTEATVYTHARELNGRAVEDLCDVNVSIGVPFGENSCLLLDASGRAIEGSGQTGELLLGGKQLMDGYFRDPEQTRSVFRTIGGERYYATGDLAFRGKSGDYFIQGRLNDTIKKRGFRVNLLDIDSYMQKVDCVQDCATIAVPDDLTENRLVAYVVLKPGESGDELRSRLKGILVDYQMPDEFRFVNGLPLNSSGKVCRKTLREAHSRAVP
jgi:acyl-CoA synthetase (AMP-forming)/AMP-acid ligase II